MQLNELQCFSLCWKCLTNASIMLACIGNHFICIMAYLLVVFIIYDYALLFMLALACLVLLARRWARRLPRRTWVLPKQGTIPLFRSNRQAFPVVHICLSTYASSYSCIVSICWCRDLKYCTAFYFLRTYSFSPFILWTITSGVVWAMRVVELHL